MSSEDSDPKRTYFLNHDLTEQERLDLQHKGLLEIMHGRAIHSPIQEPKRILEIGCGTGVMTCLLARQFPNAFVVGVDLAPVPGTHDKPDNVEYVQGDIGGLIKDGTIKKSGWDFVFSRMMFIGIRDWPGYVESAASLLKPGGWMEMQDMNWQTHGADGKEVPAEKPYLAAFVDAMTERNMDVLCGVHLEQNMKAAGLADVRYSEYPWPRTRWSEHPEGDTLADLMQSDTYNVRAGMTMVDNLLAPSGKYSPEEIAGFKEGVKRSKWDVKEGDHIKFSVCFARKPS